MSVKLNGLLSLIQRLAAQTVLTQLVAKIGNEDVQTFIAGAYAGTFPTVRISVWGVRINMVDKDIKQFLTDLKNKNWQGMIDRAVVSIEASLPDE